MPVMPPLFVNQATGCETFEFVGETEGRHGGLPLRHWMSHALGGDRSNPPVVILCAGCHRWLG